MKTVTSGDGIVIICMLVWLAVAVGPWWLALVIMGFGTAVNLVLGDRK